LLEIPDRIAERENIDGKKRCAPRARDAKEAATGTDLQTQLVRYCVEIQKSLGVCESMDARQVMPAREELPRGRYSEPLFDERSKLCKRCRRGKRYIYM
jgi:hypothetical protein